MNNILKVVVGGTLSLIMTSCYVSSMAVTDQSPGEVYVNYYPYYFCPEQNFYFNPDLNIYWWNQGGLWVSGASLPYGYHVNYNTNYVIITAYDRNPTRYYSEHIREYRRGYYVQTTYHVGDRPMRSLRSYRPERMPADRRSNSYRSDDIYGSRRNSNYNNQGSRSNSSYQNNGSRSSDARQSQSSGNPGYSNDNSNTVRQGSRTDNGGRFNSGSSSTRRQPDNSSAQPSTNNTRQQTAAPGNNNYYNRESRRRQQSDNTGSRQQPAPTPQPQSRSSQVSGQEGSRSSSNGDRQDSSRRSTREEPTNTR